MSERNFKEIVEGGWYRRRDGKVVGPAVLGCVRSTPVYPWRVGNHIYMNDGRYNCAMNDHRWDLVERVNPDGTPWVEPVERSEPATEPKKRLPQPGEKWLTRGGAVATVKARDEVSDFYSRYLSGVVLLDGGEITARWRDDGAVYSAGDQPCDLIEYIGPIEPEKRLPQPGESWLTRDGLVAHVRHRLPDSIYTLSGDILSRHGLQLETWTEEGRSIAVGGEHPNDLVECLSTITAVNKETHEPPIDEAVEAQQFGDPVDDIIEELEIRGIWRVGAVEVYVDDGTVGHNIIGRGQRLEDLPVLARLYDRAYRRWSAICTLTGKERGNGNS